MESGQIIENAHKIAISDFFFDAFGSRDEMLQFIPDELLKSSKSCSDLLYSFMVGIEDEGRRKVVQSVTSKSKAIIRNLEHLKDLNSKDFVKRYKSQMLLDNKDLFSDFSRKNSLEWSGIFDMPDELGVKLMHELPYFDVEPHVLSKLISSSHEINEHDLNDLYSTCAVLPFSNVVLLDKAFVSLIKQRRLEKKYKVEVCSDLEGLSQYLDLF